MTVYIPMDGKLYSEMVIATVVIWKLKKPCPFCGKVHVVHHKGEFVHTCKKTLKNGSQVDVHGVNSLSEVIPYKVDASYTKTFPLNI